MLHIKSSPAVLHCPNTVSFIFLIVVPEDKDAPRSPPLKSEWGIMAETMDPNLYKPSIRTYKGEQKLGIVKTLTNRSVHGKLLEFGTS